MIGHTFKRRCLGAFDARALVVFLAVFAADGQQMILCDLHGASAVEDQGVVRHIVKAVEAAVCAVSCPLILIKIGIVHLHLVVAAAVTSGILDARGEAIMIIACFLCSGVLHVEIFLQIVEEDIKPLVPCHVHTTIDVEEILLAVYITDRVGTAFAHARALEARAERPFADLAGVETETFIVLARRPIEGNRGLCLGGALPYDVDDAAERLRAVERADRAAHNLDALHIVHVDALQLIVVHRLARILRTDAASIDEDERLICIHATDGGAIADHRVFLQINAEGEFERLCKVLRAHLVDVRARDDLDGAWCLLDLLFRAGSRDNDFICDYRCPTIASGCVGGHGYCAEYGCSQKNFPLCVLV